jgi:hypothetical protein
VASLVLAAAGCAQAGPSASAQPTPPATAEAFQALWCAAFDEFTLAVGNDAGAKGPEAAALAEAARANDGPAVLAAIPAVRAHIAEFGRLGHLMASGWEPGRAFAGVANALADRLLIDLAILESTVRGGGTPAREYFGEAAFALYQKLGAEGRALSDRHRGALDGCS